MEFVFEREVEYKLGFIDHFTMKSIYLAIARVEITTGNCDY